MKFPHVELSRNLTERNWIATNFNRNRIVSVGREFELRMSDKPDVLFLRERQIAVFTAFIITKSNIILV